VILLPEWALSAVIGLGFGLVVSGLNHLILTWGQKRDDNQPLQKDIILKRYAIRFFINIAALLIVRKDTAMLIATAFGLTMSKNLLFFKGLFDNTRRKGVN